MSFSVELLVHFQCTVCQRWWTVADAPNGHHDWYCPWCGYREHLEPGTLGIAKLAAVTGSKLPEAKQSGAVEGMYAAGTRTEVGHERG